MNVVVVCKVVILWKRWKWKLSSAKNNDRDGFGCKSKNVRRLIKFGGLSNSAAHPRFEIRDLYIQTNIWETRNISPSSNSLPIRCKYVERYWQYWACNGLCINLRQNANFLDCIFMCMGSALSRRVGGPRSRLRENWEFRTARRAFNRFGDRWARHF